MHHVRHGSAGALLFITTMRGWVPRLREAPLLRGSGEEYSDLHHPYNRLWGAHLTVLWPTQVACHTQPQWSREGNPTVWLETSREISGGLTTNHRPCSFHCPPLERHQEVPWVAQPLHGSLPVPPAHHASCFPALPPSPTAWLKKEQKNYSFFYGNLYKYKYVGKHLQTPDQRDGTKEN